MSNPKILLKHNNVNRPDVRKLEISSGTGIGEVRGIAKTYACLVSKGFHLNLKKETLDFLTQPATPPTQGIKDEVLRINMVFSLGFWKPFPGNEFGSSKAFGYAGAGGSNAFADPEKELAFTYAMTKMGFYPWNDPREKALREALFECI